MLKQFKTKLIYALGLAATIAVLVSAAKNEDLFAARQPSSVAKSCPAESFFNLEAPARDQEVQRLLKARALNPEAFHTEFNREELQVFAVSPQIFCEYIPCRPATSWEKWLGFGDHPAQLRCQSRNT